MQPPHHAAAACRARTQSATPLQEHCAVSLSALRRHTASSRAPRSKAVLSEQQTTPLPVLVQLKLY